jgi:hypothetical protein
MNQCQPVLKQQGIIKAIVQWENRLNRESHCLARLYFQHKPVIVLLSEIRSNFRDDYKNPGISSDFGKVANALVKCFPEIFSAEPEQILWVAHYGQFSNYDAVGPDSFYQIPLRFNEEKFEDIYREKLLTQAEIETTLGSLEIENIYDVLREIGWTRHNE